MSYVMLDVESDGPIPGDYSMIAFGAVLVSPESNTSPIFFKGLLKPISDKWIPEALAISGYTREETCHASDFRDPKKVMENFRDWLKRFCKDRPIFISDNNGFDWQFINWYFHHFLGENPFGYSSQNLGSLYKGMVGDMFQNFKHLRKIKHTHDPVDDALGNVEALLYMKNEMGLKIRI